MSTKPTLPTFVLIGVMRAGTSSLMYYLRQHPQVYVPERKEVHFFDREWARGLEWYKSHFVVDCSNVNAVGEGTPNYIYHPNAIDRMAEVLPDTRLIVSLRNPIDRAYSHYWHNRSRGKEELSFEEALAVEERRLTGGEPYDRAFYSYADRGYYARQLKDVFSKYPQDRVHVLLFERLRSDPTTEYRRLCEFLGVQREFTPDALGRKVNQYVEFRALAVRRMAKRLPGPVRRLVERINTRKGGRYPPMEERTRRILKERFEDANVGLADLLGWEDVPWT